MNAIDLNCDMGESFGAYTLGSDEQILQYVTSANIACGFHAGDAATMKQTVRLAMAQQVGIGAHPGLPDLAGFGRRNMDITPEEAYDIVVYQVGALWGFVKSEGGRLRHVKAHGALYNMATVSECLSEAIAEAVYKIDPELVLFGLAGGELVKAGKRSGLRTASEVFADRTYQQDGTLTPRKQPDALIANDADAVAQVVRMITERKVMTRQGVDADILAETVCVHGDGPNALSFTRNIRETLECSGIAVRRVGWSALDK